MRNIMGKISNEIHIVIDELIDRIQVLHDAKRFDCHGLAGFCFFDKIETVSVPAVLLYRDDILNGQRLVKVRPS